MQMIDTPEGKTAPLQIAAASAADAPSILQLQRLAYQSEARLYDDWSIPPLQETLEQLQAVLASNVVVLKAELEGDLVGAVRGEWEQRRCTIGRLIVRPEMQGRGIARMLMQRIEAEFAKAECFELFTGSRSTRNIRLYEALGYHQRRTQVISASLTLVWMDKWPASA